ncbi:MAG: M14 family metallopeptidase [Anaerolineales bacterium]|nr:MAG: M14 family metallopeptidase [Anaerolineales bacterium]
MKPRRRVTISRSDIKWLGIGALIALVLFSLLLGLLSLLARPRPAAPPAAASQTAAPASASPPAATVTLVPSPVFAITFTPTVTPQPQEGEPFSIGKSLEGKSLDVYRFGTGPTARVIIGAIHGGYEGNTATLVYLLRDDLRSGSITVPEDITLYLLPVFNPDGFYDYLDLPAGRSNARGVDLNRNWDALWQADWDRTGCFAAAPISAGESPFSEPETRALRDFLLENRVDALISYHSAMSAIFAGGRPEPDPASDSLARALSQVSAYLYPPINDPGCQYTGQLIDWASANGIAAVDVELTDHKSNDILINRKVLEAFLNWKRGE